MSKKDLIGNIFGRLTVIDIYDVSSQKRRYVCQCECGELTIVISSNLTSGHTYSCGCFGIESRYNYRKYEHSGHQLYKTWNGIKKRCFSKGTVDYAKYGAKGITMCDEWKNNFEAFYEWAVSNGWKEGLSIDRFPNQKGNYEPSNCRWATIIEQARNMSKNVWITHEGKSMTMIEWAKVKNIPYYKLQRRISVLKMTPEKALNL